MSKQIDFASFYNAGSCHFVSLRKLPTVPVIEADGARGLNHFLAGGSAISAVPVAAFSAEGRQLGPARLRPLPYWSMQSLHCRFHYIGNSSNLGPADPPPLPTFSTLKCAPGFRLLVNDTFEIPSGEREFSCRLGRRWDMDPDWFSCDDTCYPGELGNGTGPVRTRREETSLVTCDAGFRLFRRGRCVPGGRTAFRCLASEEHSRWDEDLDVYSCRPGAAVSGHAVGLLSRDQCGGKSLVCPGKSWPQRGSEPSEINHLYFDCGDGGRWSPPPSQYRCQKPCYSGVLGNGSGLVTTRRDETSDIFCHAGFSLFGQGRCVAGGRETFRCLVSDQKSHWDKDLADYRCRPAVKVAGHPVGLASRDQCGGAALVCPGELWPHRGATAADANRVRFTCGGGGRWSPRPTDWRCQKAKDCRHKKLDVVLIADESGSIESADFQRLQDFFAGLVGGLRVGEAEWRVAYVTFDDSAEVAVGLEEGAAIGPARLSAAIRRHAQGGGGTNIASGLGAASALLAGSPRRGVGRAVVLGTDGRGDAGAQAAADRLRAQGVRLFVVGIGDAVDRAELARLSGGSKYFVGTGFDRLGALVKAMVENICEAA